MSVKDEDLIKGSEDVVKSSLAKAYEDGVTSYGSRPDDTRLLEDIITVKSNSVSTFNDIPGPKSSEINTARQQKIGSFQLDMSEIDDIIELIEAYQAEAALDAAIVANVLGSALQGADPDLPDILEQMFAKRIETEQATLNAMALYTQFAKRLDTYTTLLAKGNFLKSAGDRINLGPVDTDASTFSPRVYTCYDKIFWNKVKNSAHGDLSGYLPISLGGLATGQPGPLQKICYSTDGNTASTELLGRFTTSALIGQSCLNTEFCMDYGLPMYFFKEVFGSSSIVATIAAKVDMAICPIPAVGGGAVFDEIQKMCDLFSYKGVLTARGMPAGLPPFGQSSTDIITSSGNASLDLISDKHLRHPIFSIPTMDGFSLYDKMIYLSGIIDRELTLSSGLRMARQTSGGTNALIQILGPELNDEIHNTAANRASVPGTFPTSLGGRLFGLIDGARNNNSVYQIASNHRTTNTGAATRVLRIQTVTDEVITNPVHYPSIMPFETADPEDADFESFIHPTGGGESTQTLKSAVMDLLLENPKDNAPQASVIHNDIAKQIVGTTDSLSRLMGELSLAGHHHPNAISLGTTDPASIAHSFTAESKIDGQTSIGRMVMAAVHQHLGEMIIHSQYCKGASDPPFGSQTEQGKQALCDLLALTSFIMPNDQQDAGQMFVKTRYVKRMCELDLLRDVNVTAPGTTLEVNPFTGAPIEPGDLLTLPLTYFARNNRLKHSSKFANETIDLYKKSVYLASSGPFPLDDEVGSLGIGASLQQIIFSTNYFDIDHPGMTGAHEFGGSDLEPYTEDFRKTVWHIAHQFQKGTGTGGSSTKNIFDSTDTHGGTFAISNLSGYEIINYVFGPHPGAQPPPESDMSCLMSRIIKIADRIEDCLWSKQSRRPGGSSTFYGAVKSGIETSMANGMDRSQLLSYILEMFTILANDILESDLIHGGMSSQAHWGLQSVPPDPSSVVADTRNFWMGNSPGFGSTDNWNHHLVMVSPKKSDIKFLNLNAAVPGSETLAEMIGPYGPSGGAGGHSPEWVAGNSHKELSPLGPSKSLPMMALGTFVMYGGGFVNESLNNSQTFSQFYENLLESTQFHPQLESTFEDFPEFFDQGMGGEFSDALIGDTVTLSSFHNAIIRSAEYSSAMSYSFSPFAEMMANFKTVYGHNVGSTDNISVMEAIEAEVNTLYDQIDMPDQTITNFVSKLSNYSILNAFHHTLDQSVLMGDPTGTYGNKPADALSDVTGLPIGTRTGVNGGPFSRNLAKAVKIALIESKQRAGESQFLNIVFLGFNFQKLKDDAMHMITRDAFLNSTYKNITSAYEITFERHSEANPDIEFTQNTDNLPPIDLVMSLDVHTGIHGVSKAIDEISSSSMTFSELVDKTEFINSHVSNTGFSSSNSSGAPTPKTGEDMILEGTIDGNPEKTRKILENKLLSHIFTYMFETLTGMTVGHRLSYTKNQVYSRRSIKTFLRALSTTDIILDKDELLVPAGVFTPYDINRLGEIELQYDNDLVLNHLFEPVPATEYTGAISDPVQMISDPTKLKKAFEPILVRDGLEARFENPPVSQELYLILQSYLRSQWACVNEDASCLDESVYRPCLFDSTAAIVTNNLSDEQSFNINIEKSFPAGINQEAIDQVNDPNFRLDNYKVLLRTKLYKMES